MRLVRLFPPRAIRLSCKRADPSQEPQGEVSYDFISDVVDWRRLIRRYAAPTSKSKPFVGSGIEPGRGSPPRTGWGETRDVGSIGSIGRSDGSSFPGPTMIKVKPSPYRSESFVSSGMVVNKGADPEMLMAESSHVAVAAFPVMENANARMMTVKTFTANIIT